MAQYTLNFSDPTKTDNVVVPDMPPGINTVDTSLSLVGRGYPNYGQKIAQNFLHLLENFASPLPPENPIEGQLWYDTSDPYNKVLRIMDGTATSTRWPSSNGIYQQNIDPMLSATAALKNGDIWVDTSSNSLKIYNANGWTVVGPTTGTGAAKTATEPAIITDTSGVDHDVIVNYVGGNVVSIISKDTAFTPRIVIDGFTSVRPGVTVTTNNFSKFNGTVESALNLSINDQDYSANKFLRKDDNTIPGENSGQLITGRMLFQQPSNNAIQTKGTYGIVINDKSDSDYIQFHKETTNAVLSNNKPGGRILLRTAASNGVNVNTVSIESGVVAINTASTISSPALDVFGSVRVSNTMTVLSSAATAVDIKNGGLRVGGNISATGNILAGSLTINNLLLVGTANGSGPALIPAGSDRYDLGSPTRPFRNLYVSGILASAGTVIYGSVTGSATRLAAPTTFRMQGQVTSNPFAFSGIESNVTFSTTISREAVTSQPATATPADTLTMFVVDTSTSATVTIPQKISRKDFLGNVSFPGMIIAYGGNIAPSGWILCNGASYTISTYPNLFSAIGYNYGGASGTFYVPNLTATDSGGRTVKYIIKT
jgi:hypothetical protein